MASQETGKFCWVELSTPDTDGARSFYERLFQWKYQEHPMPQGGAYTMANAGDKGVGGIAPQPPEQKRAQVPPHWLSYVLVDDVDASSKKASTLGAKVHAGPFDVMDMGRMSVLQDPTGAFFALWQTRQQTGGVPAFGMEHGYRCWNELATTDVDRAGKFYIELFGWKAKTSQMGPMTYTEFQLGGESFAGMMQIQKEWGPVPPHWMVYFAVKDCEAAAKTTQSAGGQIIKPPSDIPNVGRFAVLVDPQGAHFSVLQPKR